jgi:hypothetical protein
MRFRFSKCFQTVVGAALLSLAFAGAPGAANAQTEAPVIHIAFVGDSMADGLWGAMFRRLGKDKCLADKVKLLRKAKNGTGLTRLDQFNWVDEVAGIAQDPGADLFVGSFGINDRQSVVEPDKTHFEYGKPAFDARYQSNVQDLIQRALAKNDSVVILGLPVMLDSEANSDALAKNKLFDAAVKTVGDPRASYVEPWTSQPAPDEYKPFIANAHGTMTQLRAQDGVHFTSFGYDLVMDHFYPAILASLKQRGRDLAAECSAQVGTR